MSRFGCYFLFASVLITPMTLPAYGQILVGDFVGLDFGGAGGPADGVGNYTPGSGIESGFVIIETNGIFTTNIPVVSVEIEAFGIDPNLTSSHPTIANSNRIGFETAGTGNYADTLFSDLSFNDALFANTNRPAEDGSSPGAEASITFRGLDDALLYDLDVLVSARDALSNEVDIRVTVDGGSVITNPIAVAGGSNTGTIAPASFPEIQTDGSGNLAISITGINSNFPDTSSNEFEAWYDISALSLTALGKIVPGDVDGNGVVSAADYEKIRDNFRKTGAFRSDGDLNGDRVVDFFDFAEWQKNFSPGGLVSSASNAIAEPATLGLFTSALIGGLLIRLRRRFSMMMSQGLGVCVVTPITAILFLSPQLSSSSAASTPHDWPQWRGPTGDNHASPGVTAPVTWSESEGIAWRAPVPGRGHSSPTVVGDCIYLTTADVQAGTQSLLIFDRTNGALVQNVVVHEGGLPKKIHSNNTHATPTVASDEERVFTLFLNQDVAWVTALDLSGHLLWQVRAIDFSMPEYDFGFGSSPVVVDGLVIVAAESGGPGTENGLVALDAQDGSRVWFAPREQQMHSYSTPARCVVDGSTQLLMSGASRIESYEASTGQLLWSTSGSTHVTCGTMVWDNQLGLAFASGGYPDKFTLAVDTAGKHATAWSNKVKCYEQSLLANDGYLYGVANNGVAYCWDASDGDVMWKERIGGVFNSSPLLVNSKIYVTNSRGKTVVFVAAPDKFTLIAENQLGDEAFATPAPADGCLYHRFATREGGNRQEYLAAIGPLVESIAP